ncbi:MAG: hypothetical protein P1U40_10415 [Coxiellaceae bacterium]|nr:hypothetical protein [Coxiellaceae bacterium]
MRSTRDTYDYKASPYADRWAVILRAYERHGISFEQHRNNMSAEEKAKDGERISRMKEKGFDAMWQAVADTTPFKEALADYNAAATSGTPDVVPNADKINSRSRRSDSVKAQATVLKSMIKLHGDLKANWETDYAEGFALGDELTFFRFADLLHDYDIKLRENVICHVWSGRHTGQVAAKAATDLAPDNITMSGDPVTDLCARFLDNKDFVKNAATWEMYVDPRVFAPPSSIFATDQKPDASPVFHPGEKVNGKGVIEFGCFTEVAEAPVLNAMGTPLRFPEHIRAKERTNPMRGNSPITPKSGFNLFRTAFLQHVIHNLKTKEQKTGVPISAQLHAWRLANPDFVERIRAKKRAVGLPTTPEAIPTYTPSWQSATKASEARRPRRISPLSTKTKPSILVPRTPKGAPPSSNGTPSVRPMSIASAASTDSPAAMSTTPSSTSSTVGFGRRRGQSRTDNPSSFFSRARSPLVPRVSRRQTVANHTRSHDEKEASTAPVAALAL